MGNVQCVYVFGDLGNGKEKVKERLRLKYVKNLRGKCLTYDYEGNLVIVVGRKV